MNLVSREAVLMCLTGENLQNYKYDELIAMFIKRIKALPLIKPQGDIESIWDGNDSTVSNFQNILNNQINKSMKGDTE